MGTGNLIRFRLQHGHGLGLPEAMFGLAQDLSPTLLFCGRLGSENDGLGYRNLGSGPSARCRSNAQRDEDHRGPASVRLPGDRAGPWRAGSVEPGMLVGRLCLLTNGVSGLVAGLCHRLSPRPGLAVLGQVRLEQDRSVGVQLSQSMVDGEPFYDLTFHDLIPQFVL
jgi:hypothetical protein